MSDSKEITALPGQWATGDREALEILAPQVYAEFWPLAASDLRRERRDHTLKPPALVNRTYVRLLEQKQTPSCRSRSHFFAVAAQLMRQILVDHARRRQTAKRSGRRASLDDALNLPNGKSTDLLALDEGLRALEALDARKSRTVELRYFGGLSVDEIAGALQISTKTVRRDLAFSEAWLYRRMRAGHP